ncbi:MAG: HIT family protein [Christensenellaceae bacterium]|nr:HIT family protein [Christensenellaceae bacterium]
MLIRWATNDDMPAWLALSGEYDPLIAAIAPDMGLWYAGFDAFMARKIAQYEALIALDRRSQACLGLLAFSRKHNRISFFGIGQKADFSSAAQGLLSTALRQLDVGRPVAASQPKSAHEHILRGVRFFEQNGFSVVDGAAAENGCPVLLLEKPASPLERHGHSFHYNFPAYARASQKAHCLACNHEAMPGGQIDIAELPYSFATGEYPGQGRLFGKMHILAKRHAVHFEDLPPEEMAGFMREVQIVGAALRKVTGAVKINYEMHANSGPHLHIHLFPRYLDDGFPSGPIDYRVSDSPYEDEEEYRWFIAQMREELAAIMP